jgi:hypothetical protein
LDEDSNGVVNPPFFAPTQMSLEVVVPSSVTLTFAERSTALTIANLSVSGKDNDWDYLLDFRV